jgi:hypothetical protein
MKTEYWPVRHDFRGSSFLEELKTTKLHEKIRNNTKQIEPCFYQSKKRLLKCQIS